MSGQLVTYKINELFQADFFGDRSLSYSVPRDSTVKAVGELVCLVIPRETFDKVCKEHMPEQKQHRDNDFYQYAKLQRRTKRVPSKVETAVILYRKKDL